MLSMCNLKLSRSAYYLKKPALLKLRKRPQDMGFGLNALDFVFGDQLVIKRIIDITQEVNRQLASQFIYL